MIKEREDLPDTHTLAYRQVRVLEEQAQIVSKVHVTLWLIYVNLTLMTGIFLGAVLVYINHIGR